MTDILTIAYIGSAFLSRALTGLMAAGFVRLAWTATGLIRCLATGSMTIHAAVFLRTLYRDVAPLVLAGDTFLMSATWMPWR